MADISGGGLDLVVAVVNSNGFKTGRVDPNIEVLTEAGFLVVDKKPLVLTPEQAQVFTIGDAAKDFLTGPVVALLLKASNGYERFRDALDDLDDIYYSQDGFQSLRDRYTLFPPSPGIERTLAILKPGYKEEQQTALESALKSSGFVILGKEVGVLPKEKATLIFGASGDAEDVEYITSGASVAYALEKIGAVDDLHLLAGPADPRVGKRVAPLSFRAKVGTDKLHNGLYASRTPELAKRDIGTVFPKPFEMERALAIIHPKTYAEQERREYILDTIKANGFEVLAKEDVYLSKQRAEQFLQGQDDLKLDAEALEAASENLSSSVSLAIVLGKPQAVQALDILAGPVCPDAARNTAPKSIRAQLGQTHVLNAIFTSTSSKSAAKDVDFFFPQLTIEKIPGEEEIRDLLMKKPQPQAHTNVKKSLNEVLIDGLVSLCRIKPVGPEAVSWLAHWLIRNNPNKPFVEEPEEAAPTLSVAETISSNNKGEAVKIIWVVGGPGSGKNTLSTKVADTHGYDVISVGKLLRSAKDSGSEDGDLINEYIQTGRVIPAHISTQLVKKAVLASGKSKFLISDYPTSLDQAFEFEAKIAPADLILFLDASEETMTERLTVRSEHSDRVDDNKESIQARLRMYKEDMFPVVEHFRVFDKVRTINAEVSEEQVLKQSLQYLQ